MFHTTRCAREEAGWEEPRHRTWLPRPERSGGCDPCPTALGRDMSQPHAPRQTEGPGCHRPRSRRSCLRAPRNSGAESWVHDEEPRGQIRQRPLLETQRTENLGARGTGTAWAGTRLFPVNPR